MVTDKRGSLIFLHSAVLAFLLCLVIESVAKNHWLIADRAKRARKMYAQGYRQTVIEKQLFGYTGGDAYSFVKAALES